MPALYLHKKEIKILCSNDMDIITKPPRFLAVKKEIDKVYISKQTGAGFYLPIQFIRRPLYFTKNKKHFSTSLRHEKSTG